MDHHCVKCNVCHLFYDVTKNSPYINKCSKCYHKEYYQRNKEKIKESSKEWNQNNKEKSKKSCEKWRRNNKEYYQKYNQKQSGWRKSEKGKKSHRIANWKKNGLICENYDEVYELWLDSTHCSKCGCQYTKQNRKCMDHCHTTGRFRSIVCHKCNMNMLDKAIRKDNISGHKNVRYIKRENKYQYKKVYYGKEIRSKRFKILSDCLCFKFIMLLRLKAGHFD